VLFVLENGTVLPKGIFIRFFYSESKIPGKNNPIWTIKNTTNNDFNDMIFNKKWFGYMFSIKGRYEITLTLNDSNGNISNEFIQIVNIS
jgi:hypothetical protein